MVPLVSMVSFFWANRWTFTFVLTICSRFFLFSSKDFWLQLEASINSRDVSFCAGNSINLVLKPSGLCFYETFRLLVQEVMELEQPCSKRCASVDHLIKKRKNVNYYYKHANFGLEDLLNTLSCNLTVNNVLLGRGTSILFVNLYFIVEINCDTLNQ